MYDKAQVILTCSSGKESGHKCMYILQEVRKACPLELSPSYSLGNAGGGHCLVGVAWMGMISDGWILGDVGGILSARMSFSSC